VSTLVFERNLPRFAASRLASSFGAGRGAGVGPLRLVDAGAPELPSAEWVRVSPILSGICGSDLSTVDGRSSRYFEDLVSFPFVPGHEVVGTLDDGTRVVVEPVLGCRARGIDPPCPACRNDNVGGCEHTAFGHLQPGLQTGFCADTGGGWSTAGLVAHPSQLHRVPEAMSDEEAVTVEPLACGVHAAFSAGLRGGESVAVIGAGTLGLATIAALFHLGATGRIAPAAEVLVGARYPHQRRLAAELGATTVLEPDQLPRAVRRRSRSLALDARSRRLTGGADVVVDCVGSSASIAAAIEMVRPCGRVVLVGMPGRVHLDLAPLWHRQVAIAGSYAYGSETYDADETVRTFDLALELASVTGAGKLVSATYPLERFEDALAHAGSAGRRGAVKVVFDLRRQPRRMR